VLQEGVGFKVKRIEVKPSARLSLQSHKHRSEHWVVVSGKALVTYGEEQIKLEPNQSTYIPLGNKHRLENPEAERLILIEVQCGSYLGEDDIQRYG
jgi:mannose-1-phosphate guanylyltransferase / mannose-6-phosphate isomerase